MTVDVAGRATNAVFTGSSGWTVQVPANDWAEVVFPVKTIAPGTATFTRGD